MTADIPNASEEELTEMRDIRAMTYTKALSCAEKFVKKREKEIGFPIEYGLEQITVH